MGFALYLLAFKVLGKEAFNLFLYKRYVNQRGGVLTHYYYVVFAFFVCAYFGIMLLADKKWKSFLLYIGSMGMAGLMSIMIFPGMTYHIFSSYRSADSMNSLMNFGAYFGALKGYGNILNKLCGDFLAVLLVFLILLTIFSIKKPHKNICILLRGILHSRLSMFAFVALMYYLTVAKIALYVTERYISLIFPLVVICMVLIFYRIVIALLNKELQNMILLFCLAFMLFNGHNGYEYGNLGSEHREMKDIVGPYNDAECVYVYQSGYRVLSDYDEIRGLKSVTFIAEPDLALINNLDISGNRYVVYIDREVTDAEAILEKFCTRYGMDYYFKMYGAAYSDAYLAWRRYK